MAPPSSSPTTPARMPLSSRRARVLPGAVRLGEHVDVALRRQAFHAGLVQARGDGVVGALGVFHLALQDRALVAHRLHLQHLWRAAPRARRAAWTRAGC
jgi:hypothetical protein